MSLKNNIWAEKWRPKTLDDGYIFHDTVHEKAFTGMAAEKTFPHLLLSGIQGSGKTTVAEILIRMADVMDEDVLTINASDENSVDVIREKIKTFVTTAPFGDFKVVLLEEADYITLNGQGILRRLIDSSSNSVRFILTCNYQHKVIPPVKSRCQHFHFKAPNMNSITERVATILINEGVKFNLDTLDKFVAVGYPDVRKIINLIQLHSKSGTLTSVEATGEASDYKIQLLDLIEQDKWRDIRKLICSSVGDEWEDMYRFLYDNIHRSTKFKDEDAWEAAITVIAKFLYKDSLISDREVNAAAMFIELKNL